MALYGVDISAYQAGPPTGKDFYWIKATEGTSYTNTHFPGWVNTVLGWGKTAGLYHFFHPEESAAAQADYFLSAVLPHMRPGMLVALDHETAARSPAQDGSAALLWCEAVESDLGYKPVVYVNQDFATDGRSAGLEQFPLWLARYGAIDDAGAGPWAKATFQQYTSSPEDEDVFFGSAVDLAALGAADWTSLLMQQLPTLKQGAKGFPVDNVQSLLNGSYHQAGDPLIPVDNMFGASTTARLKVVQGRHQLVADGVCGPKTWQMLLITA